MTRPVADKDALRTFIRTRRAAMTDDQRSAARSAIREHVLTYLTALDLPPGSTVAGYEPLRSEPGSVDLLAGLSAAGHRVLVPITLPDHDLDWHALDDPRPLGLDSIGDAAVVLLPAFAVDREGNRLGRGGGSYDRVLARLSSGTHTAALLFTGELVDRLPVEAWDRAVRAAVTPAGWLDLPTR